MLVNPWTKGSLTSQAGLPCRLMLLASSNVVYWSSLVYAWHSPVLSCPCWGQTSGGVVAVTSGPFLWHVGCASQGGTRCSVLLCVSPEWKHRLERRKSLVPAPGGSQSTAQGCCRLRCAGVSWIMGLGLESGQGVVLSPCPMGPAGICTLSLVQI